MNETLTIQLVSYSGTDSIVTFCSAGCYAHIMATLMDAIKTNTEHIHETGHHTTIILGRKTL